jgi:hypothetical protein
VCCLFPFRAPFVRLVVVTDYFTIRDIKFTKANIFLTSPGYLLGKEFMPGLSTIKNNSGWFFGCKDHPELF